MVGAVRALCLSLLWAGCAPDKAPADSAGVAPTDSAPTDSAPPVDSDPTDSATPVDSDPPGGDSSAGDTAPPAPLPLCVNEFMPDNEATLFDDAGETPDWIELHNPTAEDVDLDGWSMSDDRDADRAPLAAGLTVPAGGFLLLYADGDEDAGPDHLDFSLDADGGDVALYAPDGRGLVVGYGLIEEDFSAARVTDCCEGEGCWSFDFRGTPGATNDPPVPVDQIWLSLGSDWRYHDQDVALGAGWRAAGYDDSGWPSGPAPLGFGDHHQVTQVASGSDSDRTPTIYFRGALEVEDPAVVDSLALGLMLDDAAVVWVNDQEALRVNLPEGDLTHETWALIAVGAPDESTVYSYEIDPELLVAGTNTLAIEVHQAASTSSDLTFDLSLTARVLE